MTADPLSINSEMASVDLKERNFYDNLTEEQRKKFSAYLMIRWSSCVLGSPELQEYYLIATNRRLNKYFFSLNKHTKLQWLLATTISPGMGKQKHQWISAKKKESDSTVIKTLSKLLPDWREDDLEVLAATVTSKEIAKYQQATGMD